MSDLVLNDLEKQSRQEHTSSTSKTAAKTISALTSNQHIGLTNDEAQRRIVRDGPNDVQEKKVRPIFLFAQKFWGVSAWMIELIIVLSFILGKQADFWIALSLLMVNAIIGFMQEQHASNVVAALRSKLHVTARVLRDGSWRAIPAPELVAGDILRLRSGDFVPADAQVIHGEMDVDQSALTGESQQIKKADDDVLYSGSTVRNGEAAAVVVATGPRTYFGKTVELVGRARPKMHIEEVTTRIVKWLFVMVGVLLSAALVASMIEGLRLLEIFPLLLILLMSALPVALPVMFTVSMAIGSMELARRGVLVARLSAAEDAATMDVVCADKTGTLTMNRLSLTGALSQPGFKEDDVIRFGAFASSEANQDPLDIAFLKSARERGLLAQSDETFSFTPFSPKTRRTEALVDSNGLRLRLMKGAVQTIADAVGLDAKTVAALNARIAEMAGEGIRTIAVAQAAPDEPLKLVGLAFLRDTIRPDSRRLIDELRSLGVAVKMLTGDALPVARDVAFNLGLGKIARAAHVRGAPRVSANTHAILQNVGGLAEVFPDDKYAVVKNLQAAGHVVGMTGDGVNDAPALGQAEVGIAVENATDVAKGAASVVLTTEGLSGIVELVKIGRAVYQRVLTWIINKVSQTFLASSYVVVAFLVTDKFVISALGMVLLVFLTDFVKIALSTDYVRPSQKPETWNIGPHILLGAGLGLLMLAEALGLLAIGWRRYDLAAQAGQMHNFAFQTLLFFGLFSIFSIRERRPFWASQPSKALAMALFADGALGIVIGIFGLGSLAPLAAEQIAAIILFAIISCLGVNDFFKATILRRYEPTHLAERKTYEPKAAGALNEASKATRRWGWAAMLAIFVVLGGWLFVIGTDRGPHTRVSRAPAARTLTIDGVVEKRTVMLSPPDVSGTIKAVHCACGQTIEAGAICAVIIPMVERSAVDETKIELASARARLTSDERKLIHAERTFARAKRHAQRSVYDRRSLERARRAHKHALSQTRRAREEFDRQSTDLKNIESVAAPHEIVSPVSGTVISCKANIGQLVEAGSKPLFVVAPREGALEVHANIDAKEADKIRLGAKASVTVASSPGRVFNGVVTQVRPQTQLGQGGVNYGIVVRAPDFDTSINPLVNEAARIVIEIE